MRLYYSRKRPLEDIPEKTIPIWSCPEGAEGLDEGQFRFLDRSRLLSLHSEMVKSEKFWPR